MTKQYIVGIGDGPIAGQATFSAEFLKNCFVNFMIVDNVPESQLGQTGDFTHSYTLGTVTRSFNFLLGNKVIIDYTPCKCNC